jgi:hypothetical protein
VCACEVVNVTTCGSIHIYVPACYVRESVCVSVSVSECVFTSLPTGQIMNSLSKNIFFCDRLQNLLEKKCITA